MTLDDRLESRDRAGVDTGQVSLTISLYRRRREDIKFRVYHLRTTVPPDPLLQRSEDQ